MVMLGSASSSSARLMGGAPEVGREPVSVRDAALLILAVSLRRERNDRSGIGEAKGGGVEALLAVSLPVQTPK